MAEDEREHPSVSKEEFELVLVLTRMVRRLTEIEAGLHEIGAGFESAQASGSEPGAKKLAALNALGFAVTSSWMPRHRSRRRHRRRSQRGHKGAS